MNAWKAFESSFLSMKNSKIEIITTAMKLTESNNFITQEIDGPINKQPEELSQVFITM